MTQKPFDTTELEKERDKLQEEVDMLRTEEQENGEDEFYHPCEEELRGLQATLKERQRLKAEVEKVLDEFDFAQYSDMGMASGNQDMLKEELKKRLFGK